MASEQKILVELVIVVDYPESDILWIESNLEAIFNNLNINAKIFLNGENLGVDKSRDIGVKNSQGQMFTCIDQDDFVNENYFSVIEKYCDCTADFFIVNGEIINLNSGKRVPVYYYMPKIKLKSIIYNNLFISPSFLFVNRIFASKNNIHFTLPFNNEKGSDDWYFTIQLLLTNDKPNYIVIKDKIISYSIHDNNYSHRFDEIANGSIRLLESLKVEDYRINKWIEIKIRSLNFYKSIYNQNKIKVTFCKSIDMFKYMLIYCRDMNRMIRHLHKKIIRFKN